MVVALILLAVRPALDAVTMHLSLLEISVVSLVVRALKDTCAIFFSLIPVAIIRRSIWPFIHTLTMKLATVEIPLVSGSVSVFELSDSVIQVILPVALVHGPIAVEHRALAVKFVVLKMASIDVSIRELELTLTLLNASHPLPFVSSPRFDPNLGTFTVLHLDHTVAEGTLLGNQIDLSGIQDVLLNWIVSFEYLIFSDLVD